MAILEFEFKGIDQNFRSSASNVLKDIEKIKSAFSGIGSGVGLDLKTALDGQKIALNDTKIQTQELVKAGRELDNQNKQTRNSIAELTLEQKKLAAEQREARVAAKNVVYPTDSVIGMRNRLNELRGVHDRLSESQRNGIRVQSNLVTEINRLDAAVSKAERSTGRYQRNVGNYQQAQSGANGVAMEFNRIIQDAPFGMMGIGNNIQQLAANWGHYTEQARAAAAANGTTVTSMGLMKGALSAIVSPANLLTLGIAAITSAITYMGMNSSKAAEQIKVLNNEFSKQSQVIKNLISLSEQQVKTERDKATAISIYNRELGDTLGKVETYAELEAKLIKSGDNYVKYLQAKALAEAFYQKSLAKTAEMMDTMELLNNKGSVDAWGAITKGIRDFDKALGHKHKDGLKDAITYQEQMNILWMPPDEAQKAVEKYTFSIRQGLYQMLNQKAQSEILADKWSDMSKKTNEFADAIGGIKMPDTDVDIDIDKKKNIPKTNTSLGQTFDYLQKISDLLGSKQQDLDMFGLTGQAKELQELSNSYSDFYRELDKLRKKAAKDKNAPAGIQGTIDSAEKTGEGLENAQTLEIMKKWEDSVNSLFTDMENKVNGLAESGLEKALFNWGKEMQGLKDKIIETSLPLDQFTERLTELSNKGVIKIQTEFAIKGLEEIDEYDKKIQDILNKPFDAKNEKGITKLLGNRLHEAKTLYDQMITLIQTQKGGLKLTPEQIEKGWKEVEAKLNFKADDQSKTIFREFLVNTTQQAYQQIFSSLRSNVEEFGFGLNSIFFTIGETLKSAIDSINTQNIQDVFKGIQESGMSFFDSAEGANKGLAAAASTLGNLISSSTDKSSILGQGVGGALSGAASGLSIGAAMGAKAGPWGAAIGAGLGLISGIFSAKKAQKQEELQRRQLEEQRKANALLERMNALAYTSSIIGGQSQYGVVSGVNRNFAGEFVFRIDGRDLLATIDNNNRFNGR